MVVRPSQFPRDSWTWTSDEHPILSWAFSLQHLQNVRPAPVLPKLQTCDFQCLPPRLLQHSVLDKLKKCVV